MFCKKIKEDFLNIDVWAFFLIGNGIFQVFPYTRLPWIEFFICIPFQIVGFTLLGYISSKIFSLFLKIGNK